MRSRFLIATTVVYLGFIFFGCDGEGTATPASHPPSSQKNVVLITLDGLRQDHLSLFGYERYTSPNIDRLGREGVAFRNIIPSGCSTKTSLTSLFTSLDFRFHHLIAHGAVLSDEYETLAETFKSRGYRTGGFVATPMLAATMNYDQGFDVYADFVADDHEYVGADVVGERAIAFLSEQSSTQPFFVYVHFEEPHPPWIHGSPWLTMEEPADQFFGCTYLPSKEELRAITSQKRRNLIAKYDGAIRYADDWIGKILAALESGDLIRDTVIAVSTDHGLELLDRYSATHGYNPFDEVVRVFLVLFDGGRRLEFSNPDLVQGRIFDIGPTLLAMSGNQIPEGARGLDLFESSDRLPEFAFSKSYMGEVVRSLDYKLVHLDSAQREFWHRGIFSSIEDDEGFVLFDLRNDPGETVDVKASAGPMFERMRSELASYQNDLQREFLPGATLPDSKLGEDIVERLRTLGYVE